MSATRTSVKPIRFRLYPEQSRYRYCLVWVWPDRASMLEYLQALGMTKTTWTQAVCCEFKWYYCKPGKPRRRCGTFADLHFHMGDLAVDTWTHEISHAAIRWAKFVGCDPLDESRDQDGEEHHNERFCYAVGQMSQQFVRQLYRRKIWDEAQRSYSRNQA